MGQKVITMRLPSIDEKLWELYRVASPVSKMPKCDNCGADELGLLQPNEAFCYRCCAIVRRESLAASLDEER